MGSTLRDIREQTLNKLGGYTRTTVSLDPDPSDPLSQRSILATELYDAERGSKGWAGAWTWVGKYRDYRRCRENGYRSLAYVVYTPPTSGTYTLTFYGYGVTAPIAYNADATTIQTAVLAVNSALASANVSISNGTVFISLPAVIDTELSAGTALSQGAVGALELNRALTKALRIGDEVEVSNKIPFRDQDNLQGINTAINMALHKMWFIDRFPITPGTNSMGIQTFFGLSGEPWLVNKKQIIAVYNSAYWQMLSTFTPPGAGSYTLTLDMGIATYQTSSLAYTATGQQIQDALRAATGLDLTVTPLGTSSSFTIELPKTLYAMPILSASAGTVTTVRNQLTSPALAGNSWNLTPTGEGRYLDNFVGTPGASFYIEAYRQGYTWIAPQAAYGQTSEDWQASKDGLVNDYDQCALDVDDVATVAYATACEILSRQGPANEVDQWKKDALEANIAAAGVKLYDLDFDDAPRGGMTDINSGWGMKGWRW